MPTLDAGDLAGRAAYRLLIDCVVPRPIAWVSTVDLDGRVNLAPFSFFQALGGKPPAVMLSIGRHRDGTRKDTGTNALATGELVVNIVSDDLAEAMNATCGTYPPDVDELGLAGLTAAPCRHVRAPRVAESPVSLECRLLRSVQVGPESDDDYIVLIAEVVCFHVRDDLWRDGRVEAADLRPLARLGGDGYAHLGAAFDMARPQVSRTDPDGSGA